MTAVNRMESREKCEEIISMFNGKVLSGSQQPLLVKFADGGNKNKRQHKTSLHDGLAAQVGLVGHHGGHGLVGGGGAGGAGGGGGGGDGGGGGGAGGSQAGPGAGRWARADQGEALLSYDNGQTGVHPNGLPALLSHMQLTGRQFPQHMSPFGPMAPNGAPWLGQYIVQPPTMHQQVHSPGLLSLSLSLSPRDGVLLEAHCTIITFTCLSLEGHSTRDGFRHTRDPIKTQ